MNTQTMFNRETQAMQDSNGNALQVGHVYAGFLYDEDGTLCDTGVFVCFAGNGHLYDCDTTPQILDEYFDVLVEQTGSRMEGDF